MMLPLFTPPLAQSLQQLIQSWLHEASQYEPILYFDLDTFLNLLEKEPLALTAVAIALMNIVLTVFFKVSDYWKESMRELSQRANLHIEAHPVLDAETYEPAIQVVVTNTGKEPVIIRDVGYQSRSLIRRLASNLSPITLKPVYHPFDRAQMRSDLPDVTWPVSMHPREFFEFRIRGEALDALKKGTHRFTVRDSLGMLWIYRGSSIESLVRKSARKAARSANQRPSAYYAESTANAVLLSEAAILSEDLHAAEQLCETGVSK